MLSTAASKQKESRVSAIAASNFALQPLLTLSSLHNERVIPFDLKSFHITDITMILRLSTQQCLPENDTERTDIRK